MTRQRIETTFADLRNGDHLIDKSGKAWPVDGVQGVDFIVFWLHDTDVECPAPQREQGAR